MKSKKSFGIVLSALILASFLTACNKDKPADNTPAPTAQTTEAAVTAQPTTEITEAAITEVPTVETTEDIAPEPVKYNEQDYKLLRDFFELADKDGVKNGEKCFKDYNPDRVNFWGENYKDSLESWLFWDENGDFLGMDLFGSEEHTIELVGELKLRELAALSVIWLRHITIESVDIENCSKLSSASNIYCVKDAILIGDYLSDFGIESLSHCHYESSGIGMTESYAFIADMISDGEGSTGVAGFMDEDYYHVKVHATPSEGHKFIGWYDSDGKLISTDEIIEISYCDADGTGVNDFDATAKFE